jgi:hypothetical protein
MRKCPDQLLFICSALLIGLVFWHQANWWVYVDDDPEPILKFELPWWLQVPAAVIVGALGATLLLVCLALCRTVLSGKANGQKTSPDSSGNQPARSK